MMFRSPPVFLHRSAHLPLAEGEWETLDEENDTLTDVPLLGTVSAGMPIEACNESDTIAIPTRMVRRNTYALKVRGNSMVDCNIHDGDIIVIERFESAENGETAVVLINNHEVTLKKLYIEKGGVRLQPANATMPPIFLKNDDVQVLGLVMGVMRQSAQAA